MHVSFRDLLAGLAAIATLALAAPVQAEKVGAYHIMPTPEYKALTGRDGVAAAGKMNYYGGAVFGNVKVISVIWGGNVPMLIWCASSTCTSASSRLFEVLAGVICTWPR